ncbi:MAG: DUF3048 domain-containing protein [Anaerolineae bacterium]|nr:DUF3048 domain-containing protein [Anaerolineae bacterium]
MKRSQIFATAGLLIFVTLVVFSLNSGVTSARQGSTVTAFPTNTIEGSEDFPVGSTQNTPTPSLTPSPESTVVALGPFEYPENINPLTGLPYPNEDARDRRNLIIKISNYPPIVRPQYGLSAADIVFEYEAEGGVTRFAAIFRSHSPGRVGSIRSARLVDLELVNMFQGLLAYSGSNDWIRNYILESDWRWRAITPHFSNYPCPTFCRYPEPGKAFEHTLFGDTDGIWAEAERIDVNQGMQAVGLAFSETPDPDGDTASDISIDWYSPQSEVRWQYNPADGKYYRWDSGLPHIDLGTGEQITTDNLVILEVWHTDRPDVYESEVGGIALEHQLWGYSRAWLFRDGQWYQGWWYRNREYGSIQLRFNYNDRNDPMHLKPGNTWFEIVRKFDPYVTEGPMFSVTVSDELVDAQATAEVVSATGTAVWVATSTQFAEWNGSPTPFPTSTPFPTLTPLP